MVATTGRTLRLHRFLPGTRLEAEDDGLAIVTAYGPVRFRQPSEAQAAVLGRLEAGASEAELTGILEADGPAAVPWLFFTLTRLGQLGIVEIVIRDGEAGNDLLTIQPIARTYQPSERRVAAGDTVQFSRFALVHQVDGQLAIESPRSPVRVLVGDWRAAAVVHAMAGAGTVEELGRRVPDLPDGIVAAVAEALVQSGMAEIRRDEPDTSPTGMALDQWEFHDLYFHSRSRSGRHRNPYGGTYRYEGQREPLPAVKAFEGEAIPLPKPDVRALMETDPPLVTVMEHRRSRRVPGPEPLTIDQLGEFLFRTARVRGRMRTEHEEVSNRTYPGGGADYELEIYPVVNRVEGLERGVYAYQPLEHALYRLAEPGQGMEALLRDTASKAPPGIPPDVLLAVTARFQRLTYKYQSIAYAVALKDLGVVYHGFYLAATAMGLSPCAVGGGDADLFASVSGVPFYVEPHIGEFLLSSSNPEEQIPMPPGVI